MSLYLTIGFQSKNLLEIGDFLRLLDLSNRRILHVEKLTLSEGTLRRTFAALD
jgi:hypothetical protein